MRTATSFILTMSVLTAEAGIPTFRVGIDGTWQRNPAISGNIMVWDDFRKGYDLDPDIWGKNLQTGKEFCICTNAGPCHPAISGQIVVWQEGYNQQWNRICGKNLQTGEQFVVSAGDWHTSPPVISGQIVAWRSGLGIFAKNLATGEEFTVCPSPAGWYPGDHTRVAVSGQIVVCDNGCGFLGLDLATGTRFTNSVNGYDPAISGSIVVCSSPTGIVGQNLVTGEQFAISDSWEFNTGLPRISGDIVVYYSEYRGILARYLSSGSLLTVTGVGGGWPWCDNIAIDGNTVVWEQVIPEFYPNPPWHWVFGAIIPPPDTTKPSLNITIPAAGQRWSNALFTVMGTAGDNVQVSNVWCQLNDGSWTKAASGNGWTNWTAIVNLAPGTNVVRAYATDTAGNVSQTATNWVIYVVTDRLQVQALGQGTLTPNYSNAVLEIGKSYSMKANGVNGHVFTNWVISTNWVGGVISNDPTLSFIMRSNLTAQVNFVDVTKPTLALTSPTTNQRWSNVWFTVKGTAKDNLQVSNVWCQVNGANSCLAQTTNGWTNWTTSVLLTPRTNLITAYAVDCAGNNSTTNSVRLVYVVTNLLQVAATGKGTLSPNYSNAWLEIGLPYSMTATPASGFVFTNWTISTNWLGGVTTNAATVKFMMASNLTLQANFVDVTKPTLAISSPASGQPMTNALATIRGTASDNWGISGVWYQLNSGVWSQPATTNSWTNWTTTVELIAGTNVFKAYAVDLGGNYSATNSLNVVSSNTFKLQLGFDVAQPLASNGLNFIVHLSPGLNGRIQVSTNLLNWATLANFIGTNTTLYFQDSVATNYNGRFYRAVTP